VIVKAVKPDRATIAQTMPLVPELAALLRAINGKDKADAQIRQAMQGGGRFYVAQIGPDGVLREFGSSTDGRRAALVDGQLQWVNERGQRA